MNEAWNSMTPAERAEYCRSNGITITKGTGGELTKYVDADGQPIPDGMVIPIEAFKTLAGEIGKLRKAQQTQGAELNDLLKQMANLANPNRPSGTSIVPASVGTLFCKSDSYRNTFEGRALTKLDSNSSASATIEGGIIKTLTSATAVPDRTRVDGIVPAAPMWSNFLWARCAPGQMTGGVLEYVQDTSPAFDPSTPPTAEAALKPGTDATFALKTLTPKTIAHWMEASRQILADAAALRSYLDVVLVYRLLLRLEHQVVNGDGTGTNMQGLMAIAPDAGAAVAGDTPLDTIRKAIGVVEASGWVVDTVGVNPTDWGSFQLIKGADGHYVFGDPVDGTTGAQPAWGKIVVPSPSVAAGKYLVGAFAQGAQLFERENASVYAGFQNDNFIRNLVTLLAEMRADLAVYASSAFRQGSLT